MNELINIQPDPSDSPDPESDSQEQDEELLDPLVDPRARDIIPVIDSDRLDPKLDIPLLEGELPAEEEEALFRKQASETKSNQD